MTAPAYITEVGADVVTVRMDNVAPGWEQWFLVMADDHWDNPHCRRDLHTKHLKQAKERNAGVLQLGDFFCAMQGKWDKRANKGDLRPEHQDGRYLDVLVKTAAEYLDPYAENYLFLAHGNHETPVLGRHETDLTENLAERLSIPAMGFSGFVRFLFSRKGQGSRTSRILFWHHGSGGGGDVTKGTIQSNRRGASVDGVDIVCSGHIHESWYLTIPKVRLNAQGKWETFDVHHLCTATYKDEYTMSGGWHIERGAPPKPLGAWWLRFHYDADFPGNVAIDPHRAQ